MIQQRFMIKAHVRITIMNGMFFLVYPLIISAYSFFLARTERWYTCAFGSRAHTAYPAPSAPSRRSMRRTWVHRDIARSLGTSERAAFARTSPYPGGECFRSGGGLVSHASFIAEPVEGAIVHQIVRFCPHFVPRVSNLRYCNIDSSAILCTASFSRSTMSGLHLTSASIDLYCPSYRPLNMAIQ
jgi:hypothetical protein